MVHCRPLFLMRCNSLPELQLTHKQRASADDRSSVKAAQHPKATTVNKTASKHDSRKRERNSPDSCGAGTRVQKPSPDSGTV
ncbi:hypothetical protein BaRGS_00028810 [Batillaria attramentaria]|uniref:Uncharacterized protein n=1 Tax=Batillaria attramentaria TaxID=370345 RepID=A0ABD0JZJ0_9CAEN